MSERFSASRSVWLRPKGAVFLGIGAMTLYVLYHNERFLIQPANPIWRHYAEIAFWLVPHAVAGTCALFLAPLQFSERLRKRYTTAHHIVGRVYVIGALVLAPLGAYGQYLSEASGAPREFTTLAVVDAVMLMTTTLVAYLFAIRRRITQHRQWMTRSYAVALVFFEGRLLGGLLGLDSNVNATMAAIWACLALSMVFAELANSFYEIKINLRAPAALRGERDAAPAYSATS
jgi:Predicted membrane protein (DUF2306)